jgi:rod shape-determining protein MreB
MARLIHVAFRSDWLSVRDVGTDTTHEDKPVVAIKTDKKGQKTVVAVGREAETVPSVPPDLVTIVNGFDHPRSCIADMETAVAALKHFLHQILPKRMILRPIGIIQPLEKTEGGLTSFEKQGLMEIAIEAGFREVYICAHPELPEETIQKIKNGTFKLVKGEPHLV